MRYCSAYYTDPILWLSRMVLYNLVSAQFAFGVFLAGLFAVTVLQAFRVSQHIIDSVFVPCAAYFCWAFLVSLVDISIERDEL